MQEFLLKFEVKKVDTNRQTLKLSNEMEEQIKQLFTEMDRNGNGFLEEGEVFSAMHQIGLNPSQADLRDCIRKVDQDNDGRINYAEFRYTMMSKV